MKYLDSSLFLDTPGVFWNTMRLIRRSFVALTFVVLAPGIANAEQQLAQYRGQEVVVHSNPIPVILHRLVPPNYGRHVTVREYHAGRASSPPTRRPASVSPQRDSRR